jgi:UPF0271 protein
MINCDLGEDESARQTGELLTLIDAANIGCGVHAGSVEKTRSTLLAAQKAGIRIGAHPGLSAQGGRGQKFPSAADFRQLLRDQVGTFRETAKPLGAVFHHIKLHGSLYHAVESDAVLAETYVDFLRSVGEGVGAFCLAGGSCAERCRTAGIQVFEEVFADRAYRANGSLVSRGEPGAVLSAETALARLRGWLATGRMPTIDGQSFPLKADTLCVHGDSPGAIPLLQTIRQIR